MVCSRASAVCASAGTIRIFSGGMSGLKARAACCKTCRLNEAEHRRRIFQQGGAKRFGVPARAPPPSRALTAARSPECQDEWHRLRPAPRGCGFQTKKSIPSFSWLFRAPRTFGSCRARKPCNSKYSRTMVSLTAAMVQEVGRSVASQTCDQAGGTLARLRPARCAGPGQT